MSSRRGSSSMFGSSPSPSPEAVGELFTPIDGLSRYSRPPASLFGGGCPHPHQPLHIPLECSNRPIGTNKWYTQLALGSDPVYPLPYAFAILDGHSVLSLRDRTVGLFGLGIIHSTLAQRVFGPPVSQEPDSSAKFYYNPVVVSVSLGAMEFSQSSMSSSISGWSELAVQLELSCLTEAATKASISFPIVRGSAFVTAVYTALTPRVCSTHTIVSLECLNSGQEDLLFGFRKHRVRYGDSSTWLIYSSPQYPSCRPHLDLQMMNSTDLGHQGAWDGVIQIVKMSEYYGQELEEDEHRYIEESVYDRAAGAWPKAGTLRSGALGSGEYAFDWITCGPRSEQVSPLMFALPHHIEAMTDRNIIVKPEIRILSRVTGVMRLCRSSHWAFRENIAAVIPYGIRPYHLSKNLPIYDPLLLNHLRETMVQELGVDFDAESNLNSYYFSGKKLAKQSLQCLTASCILQDQDLAEKFVKKTKKSFTKFSQNKTKAAPLVYEKTWKGIISSSILVSGNRNDDFGNGIYNDHHFHFAYFIYAAAVLVFHDPCFLSSIRDYVQDLIRDVNNPDQSDPYFPLFRNFDWFLGHSLATGLDTSMDGKNQESCSEDANFLYSIKVWAEVTKNPTLRALADLQLCLFKRSVNHYYYMAESNVDAPSRFKGNRVPGILFENKADYTTFFSDQKDAIHMIQVIPITPITPFIRLREFIWQEWTNTGSPIENANQICHVATKFANGYQTLLFTQYGIVDPVYAYNLICKRISKGMKVPLDDGISLSWILGFLINQMKLQQY